MDGNEEWLLTLYYGLVSLGRRLFQWRQFVLSILRVQARSAMSEQTLRKPHGLQKYKTRSWGENTLRCEDRH